MKYWIESVASVLVWLKRLVKVEVFTKGRETHAMTFVRRLIGVELPGMKRLISTNGSIGELSKSVIELSLQRGSC